MLQSEYYIKFNDNGNKFIATKNENVLVKNLDKGINSSYGEYAPIIKKDENLHEAGLLHLEIKKSIENLGWCPCMTSKDSVDMTIQWYDHVLKQKKTGFNVTKNQIEKYFSKAIIKEC